jgi:hypothetical protein
MRPAGSDNSARFPAGGCFRSRTGRSESTGRDCPAPPGSDAPFPHRRGDLLSTESVTRFSLSRERQIRRARDLPVFAGHGFAWERRTLDSYPHERLGVMRSPACRWAYGSSPRRRAQARCGLMRATRVILRRFQCPELRQGLRGGRGGRPGARAGRRRRTIRAPHVRRSPTAHRTPAARGRARR